jgi:pimeloyl-ACP methyl ester carboxylesterase
MERTEITVGPLVFDAWAAGPFDGTPVMLLHGFPQAGWCYRNQIEALGAAGYRAVAPDQRGYSSRARPADVATYGMSHLVTDVCGMADTMGWDRFHLVGHDWGAMVAWAVAASDPDRLLSVTPISVPHPQAFARALAGEEGSDQATRSSYINVLNAYGAEEMFLKDDARVLRSLFAVDGITSDDVEVYVKTLSEPGAMTGALNWYRAMIVAGDGDARVGVASFASEVTVPTMFVWSTNDAALGPEGASWTREYVSAPYVFIVLEGITHWIPEQAAEQLTKLLLEELPKHT